MEKIKISFLQAIALAKKEVELENLIAPPESIDLTKFYVSHEPDKNGFIGKIEQTVALPFWKAHYYERIIKGLTHHLLKDSTVTLNEGQLAHVHCLVDKASMLQKAAMNEAFKMLDEAYPETVGKTILLYPGNYFRIKE